MAQTTNSLLIALGLGEPDLSSDLARVARAAVHGSKGAPTPVTALPSSQGRAGIDPAAIYGARREQTAQPVSKPAAESVDWAAIVAEQNAKLPAGAIIPGATRSKALDPSAVYAGRRAQTEAAPQSAVPAGLMAAAVAKLNAEGRRSSAGFRTSYETYAARRAQMEGDR